MRTAVYTILLAIFLGYSVSRACACDSGTVRDAAVRAKRDMHRLSLIAHGNDPSAGPALKQLEAWLHGDAADLNLTLERIDADDASVDWRAYGIPSVPPRLPVVALIGEFPSPRRAFVVDHWEPGPSDADLSVLKSSPAREVLKAALTNRWAAILYAPGAEQAQAAVEAAFQAIEKKWAQDQPPGVSVVRFDRSDPQERLLCAFAGIEPSGPDWAGVVFGRGKLMAPPLQGDEITEGNLTELLQRLAVPCTCLQQSITLGLDIPMTWEPVLDAKVPMGVPSQGYVEVALDKPAAPTGVASLMEDIPQEDRHVVATAVVPLACASAVAGVAIALVIWRTRRRNAKLLEDRCAIE